jgi:endonuclease/exonuclease/phosphatase family metal-dependent hydrolase
VRVREVCVPWTSLTRVTSDHAPVIVDIELPAPEEAGEAAE